MAVASAAVDLQCPPAGPLSERMMSRLIWAFVALGAAARLCRYLLRFPLWEDEAFLAYNLMNRGFAELLQPLDYIQAAPLGYLWLQRAIIDCCGFTEYSLRLTALAAGLLSLLIFRRLAVLVLPNPARLLAVAVFAVSYPMIRYSAEAKPYGIDLFLCLCLLWLFAEWRQAPQRRAWLWALLLAVSLAPFVSFPTVFVGGAISLAWLAMLWRSRPFERRATASWLAFNALMAAAFVVHLRIAQAALGDRNEDFFHDYWKAAFPPLLQPMALLRWLLSTHTGEFFAYPLGSRNGGSILTFLGVMAGLWAWLAQGRRRWLLLAVVPLALHFVAAGLQRFPYGGHVKFGLYWAPCGALLLGSGLAAWLTWVARRRNPRPLLYGILGTLALVPLGVLARDFAIPGKTRSDLRSRDLVRWFWFDVPHEGVVVCLHADWQRTFTADLTRTLNWSASYACNLRIYSPRHACGAAAPMERVTPNCPLQCVEYRVSDLVFDERLQQRWLEQMAEHYHLVSHEQFPVTRYDKRDAQHLCTDHLHIYRFVPRPAVAPTPSPAGPPATTLSQAN